MKGLAITVMFSLLQFGCAKESEVLNGPFLIKDGVTFDQMTNQSVTGIILDLHDNGQLKTRSLYRKGLQEGLFESFHENGQLRERITYLSGVKNGLEQTFDSDGRLISSLTLAGGIKNGIEKQSTYPSAASSRITHTPYVLGTKEGIEELYIDGVLREQKSYQNGIAEGPYTLFYQKNGKIKLTYSYVGGKKHGAAKGFRSTEEKAFIGNYIDGYAEGENRVYNAEGELHARWNCKGNLLVSGSLKLTNSKLQERFFPWESAKLDRIGCDKILQSVWRDDMRYWE